jgi:hypothetical protein
MRLIALCLLCFTLQSALASTHFHIKSSDGAAHATLAWQTDTAKRAAAHENASCALCQFLVLGSAALHPASFAVLAPVESVSFIVANQTFAHLVAAVSHSWQGRGPPLI